MRFVLSRGGGFGGNSYGGGYGGGGGGFGGGYGGGGGDRMSHLGAGLQKQDWGKSSQLDVFTALADSSFPSLALSAVLVC